MNTVEIYFSDLNEEAQEMVLKANNIESPADANWDVFPLAILDFETELDDVE